MMRLAVAGVVSMGATRAVASASVPMHVGDTGAGVDGDHPILQLRNLSTTRLAAIRGICLARGSPCLVRGLQRDSWADAVARELASLGDDAWYYSGEANEVYEDLWNGLRRGGLPCTSELRHETIACDSGRLLSAPLSPCEAADGVQKVCHNGYARVATKSGAFSARVRCRGWVRRLQLKLRLYPPSLQQLRSSAELGTLLEPLGGPSMRAFRLTHISVWQFVSGSFIGIHDDAAYRNDLALTFTVLGGGFWQRGFGGISTWCMPPPEGRQRPMPGWISHDLFPEHGSIFIFSPTNGSSMHFVPPCYHPAEVKRYTIQLLFSSKPAGVVAESGAADAPIDHPELLII